jgi:zeaxanthin epoxidase
MIMLLWVSRTMDADVLVGADGIWSSIRAQMWNQDARGPKSGTTYSGYTCFAGDTIQRTPFYFDVGYQVRFFFPHFRLQDAHKS